MLVSQDRTRVEVRTVADGAVRTLESADDVLRLDSIGFACAVREIHA